VLCVSIVHKLAQAIYSCGLLTHARAVRAWLDRSRRIEDVAFVDRKCEDDGSYVGGFDLGLSSGLRMPMVDLRVGLCREQTDSLEVLLFFVCMVNPTMYVHSPHCSITAICYFVNKAIAVTSYQSNSYIPLYKPLMKSSNVTGFLTAFEKPS
jgi:hypothetical protein